MNPLTGLYGAATALRNTLFDRGVLTSRRLERPVVSVGNLSAGGSGKTPFVIALGELLKARGIRFDVLSRGYGRKTRGVLVVEPDGNAADFGDEPLLIARRLGVPVIVGESRYRGGPSCRSRNFNTQVAHSRRRLSAPFSGARFRHRADDRARFRRQAVALGTTARAAVLARSAQTRSCCPAGLPVGSSGAAAKGDLGESNANSFFRSCLPRRLFSAASRGREQFFAQVRAAGISPAAEVEFRDHHAYDREDLERLLALRGKNALAAS